MKGINFKMDLKNLDDNYYIIRGNWSGVFFGQIVRRVEKGDYILKNVRRIFYWDGANTIQEIALHGILNHAASMLTVIVPEMEITDVIELIKCSPQAVADLKEIREWKIQN